MVKVRSYTHFVSQGKDWVIITGASRGQSPMSVAYKMSIAPLYVKPYLTLTLIRCSLLSGWFVVNIRTCCLFVLPDNCGITKEIYSEYYRIQNSHCGISEIYTPHDVHVSVALCMMLCHHLFL